MHAVVLARGRARSAAVLAATLLACWIGYQGLSLGAVARLPGLQQVAAPKQVRAAPLGCRQAEALLKAAGALALSWLVPGPQGLGEHSAVELEPASTEPAYVEFTAPGLHVLLRCTPQQRCCTALRRRPRAAAPARPAPPLRPPPQPLSPCHHTCREALDLGFPVQPQELPLLQELPLVSARRAASLASSHGISLADVVSGPDVQWLGGRRLQGPTPAQVRCYKRCRHTQHAQQQSALQRSVC